MADVPNNLQNSYYQKQNHISLPKNEVTKELILSAAIDRATGLGKSIRSLARQLSDLFRASEKGVVFIPATAGTLYQTTAMILPATPGDPVGMMLDQSQWGGAALGSLYGPELVTNGTFDTDTDWTKGIGWTISGGVATHGGVTASNLTQAGILTIGKTYNVRATLGNSFSVNVGSGGLLTNQSGSINASVVCSGSTDFYIRTATDGITADNVSVREITVANALAPIAGPELVTNGTFVTDVSGWAAPINGTLSWSSGKLRVTVDFSGFNNTASQTITTVIGQVYQITLDADVGTAVDYYVKAGNVLDTGVITTASPVLHFVANGTSTAIQVTPHSTVIGEYAEFDNISVKEIPGYHATQATAAKRPIYGIHPFGGRRNLLTYSEDFTNAVWTKDSVTVSGQTLTATAATANHRVYTPTTLASGVTYTFSTNVEYVNNRYINLRGDKTANGATGGGHTVFDLVDGVVVSDGVDIQSSGITETGPSQFTCWIVYTTTGSGVANNVIGLRPDATAPTSNNAGAWAAAGTEQLIISGVQFEQSATATAYQKVTSQYVVTETGVPSVHYLKFDGVDDAMVTPSINFSASDEMSVFAGVRKLNDVLSVMVELSASAANAGSFNIVNADASNYRVTSNGSLQVLGNFPGSAAPSTDVLTLLSDISADSLIGRKNGVATTNTTDQGTGNYGNYPLYIGARNLTGFPFTGNLYGLTVRGALSDAAEIADAEGITAELTGITL
jgi:hypothetical protein